MVPQCSPDYTVFIGPPSDWFPDVTLITQFSLVPHLIGPPKLPWLHSSHWSPSATLSTLFLTNEMGDQWEHGRKGYTGGLMRWETNEIWYPGLHSGTNEMGDQWELYNQGYIGGPMR